MPYYTMLYYTILYYTIPALYYRKGLSAMPRYLFVPVVL